MMRWIDRDEGKKITGKIEGHTGTHTRPHTPSLSHTHTHILTLTLSHTHKHSHTHSLSHTHTQIITHSYPLSYTLSHIQTHKHTHMTQEEFVKCIIFFINTQHLNWFITYKEKESYLRTYLLSLVEVPCFAITWLILLLGLFW